jgi:lycopene beta-cyclase
MNNVFAPAELKENRTIGILVVVWVLTMVALPIVRYTASEAFFYGSIAFSVLVQAVVVMAIVQIAWGWVRTWQTLLIIAVLTWLVEVVGSATGLPFGQYSYTDNLQPQLAHVPLIIPLAWFMMLPPAWAIAQKVAGRHKWAFILVSAAALTAWDLFLDPQMVAWDLWVWEQPGGYFGIPWLNYAGWFLTAVALTAVIRPRPLPIRPLLLIYTITWILETIGLLFFWGLIGPGLVGFVGMGFFVLLGWRQSGKVARRQGGHVNSKQAATDY